MSMCRLQIFNDLELFMGLFFNLVIFPNVEMLLNS